MKIKYDYCKKNLLENPEKYQRTSFKGIDFLQSYIIFRKNIIYHINSSKIPSHLEILSLIEKKNNCYKPSPNIINLEQLLIDLLLHPENHNNLNQKIDKIIKKFEIFKKLPVKLNQNFNNLNDDYSNFRNYLLLSQICLEQYQKTKNLKFLNCSLKLNDFICSINSTMIEQTDQYLLKYILELEIKNIVLLCKRKGVKIDA